jgi:2-dehydro-3-deoxy-D-gluconate 5-dehydrogenase
MPALRAAGMDPHDLFNLSGRTAIVTGGAGGLGSAMASALAGAGASIVLVDRDGPQLHAAAEALVESGAAVLTVEGDVTDPAVGVEAAGAASAGFGPVDILVCAAGRALRKDAFECSDIEYDELMAVNLRAVFQWNRAMGRLMAERGTGAIINIASQGAFAALRRRPLYNASKAGVVQLTRSLAADWIGSGVRVNAIAPGLMDTPFIAEMKADAGRIAVERQRIPAGRLGHPADLAGAVLLLASDAGAYIVGHTLIVDGGWTLG